jgi:hypothetical protein
MGEHHSLIEKFLPIEELGVGPIPVSPQDRSETALPIRHHKVGGDAAALGARVANVVDGDEAAMLYARLPNVERRLSVIVKSMRVVLGIDCGGDWEQQDSGQESHRYSFARE